MTPETPHLRRVLGRWDLVLLFVVAVFNLNVVPSIAANGGVTVWLWIISLLLFFWPQGIAVVELAHRYPGEGGVYLWAKEVFGDFHGFLSGWCYWTNNMMYVPTVMLYFVGVFVFVLGAGHESLADNKSFALTASLILLVLLVVLNIVGLGVGKWVNNLGAIGTFVAAAVLIGFGTVMWMRFGTPLSCLVGVRVAGIGSAWLGGAARIPFVAGLDSYMPDSIARIHPKYATPYAALIGHAAVSLVLVVINFSLSGAGVQETFQKLLSLAVVLQLIPFLYLFGVLMKIASSDSFVKGRYGKTTLTLAGFSGFTTTGLGIALAFFPTQQIKSLLSYEIWMFGGTLLFVGLAAFLFFIYGRRKAARKLAAAPASVF